MITTLAVPCKYLDTNLTRISVKEFTGLSFNFNGILVLTEFQFPFFSSAWVVKTLTLFCVGESPSKWNSSSSGYDAVATIIIISFLDGVVEDADRGGSK